MLDRDQSDLALPFLVLAGVSLLAPVAPLEAARIDVVNPQLRGRVESARTLARVVAQSTAPLLFGLLSEALAGITPTASARPSSCSVPCWR